MNEPSETKDNQTMQMASLVRFSKEQASALGKDRLVSGKSIPTLLKDRYFKNGPINPIMPVDEARELMKQLSYFNRNLNQLTRYLHGGINGTVVEDFHSLFRTVNKLLERVSLEYGNSKNSI